MEPLNTKIVINKDATLTVSWAAISKAVKYDLRIVMLGADYMHCNEKNLTVTSFKTNRTKFEDNKQYDIVVIAYDSTGRDISSEGKRVLVPLGYYDDVVPAIPQNVRATSTVVSATIQWDAVFRARSYDLLFNGTIYNITTTSKTITGLSPKTNYSYAVRAKGPSMTGAYSPTKTITTLPQTPAVPAGITKTVTENSAAISWNPVNGATSYDIIFNGSTFNTTSTSRNFLGLGSGIGYQFQIRAKNADAASAYTAAFTVTTAPKAPTTVSAASTANSVTVNWSAVSGASGYSVRFNGSDYGASAVQTTSTFSGLVPSTTYSYQVCSKSADGAGSYSTIKTIKTLPQPPSIPTSIQGKATENSATVSWGSVNGATSYDLLFNGTTYNVTGTSKTISGLTPNRSYNYSVRAKNADGPSSYSSTYTITTPPTAPTSASVTTSEGTVTVSWNAVLGATSYDVLFNGTTYNVTGTSKTFTGLSANTGYSYQICTKNGDGTSSYSPVKTVKTTPYAPTNPSATANKDSVTINWNSVSGATSYDVLFDGKVNNTTGTSKTITGLMSGTKYNYQIRSNNANGSSSYGNVQTVSTVSNLPSVPENVKATATANAITVTWNSVSQASNYEVLFNGTVYKEAGLRAAYTITGTTKTFTGLSPQTNYTYAVRACNAEGASAYSVTQSIQTLPLPPAVPANVNATSTKNSVTVSFSAVSGAASYDILFNGTVYNQTHTYRTFTGLLQGTDYTYSVRAKNAGGSSAYSTKKTIRTLMDLPAVPSNINAVPKADSIKITWDKVTGASSYEVKFGANEFEVDEASAEYTLLEPRTYYNYAVRAKNSAGNSAYSTTKSIRTLLLTPSMVFATAGFDSITVSWDAVEGADGYDVKVNENAYRVPGTYQPIPGLKTGVEYTYAVRAKDALGFSEYSEEQKITTVLGVPSNVTATSTINSVSLHWNTVEGATSYDVEFDDKVYRVEDATKVRFAIPEERQNISRHYKGFNGLKPDKGYDYRVRANTENASSEYSSLESIRTKDIKRSGLPHMKGENTYPDGRYPYLGLDPINTINGAFLWSYTFLEDRAKESLVFNVMYDSQREDTHTTIGKKWTYSLNYLLYNDSEFVYFSTPYDETVCFAKTLDGRNFDPVPSLDGSSLLEMKNYYYMVYGPDGREYTFDENLTIRKIKENGNITQYYHANEEGRIYAIDGDDGARFTIEYESGRISKVSDRLGNEIYFTYDGDLLVSVKNPEGNSIFFTYDKDANLTEISDFAGKRHLRNIYDERGRVIAQNTLSKGDAFIAYDEKNKITTITDELKHDTSYFYNDNCCVSKVESDGIILQSKYNEKGQLTEQIDALGNITKMSYDEAGRMNQVLYPDGSKEKALYNQRNYPVTMINRDGTEITYVYDENDNLTSLKEERGNTNYYTYNSYNKLTSYQDKNGDVWNYEYDIDNRLRKVTDPAGNSEHYLHDVIGRLISYTSPSGAKTTYTYTKTGELLSVKDADGTITYTYNENGNQTSVTDRMGNIQHLEYNNIGQVTMETDFLGNEYHFGYDEKGQLIKETDPLGNYRIYVYDARGNNTKQTDKNGETTEYSFDAIGQMTAVKDALANTVTYTYDTMGKISMVTDALANQTSYIYDTMGRITKVTNALDDSVSYTYDAAGNLLTKTNEAGMVTAYTYDKENRLTNIQNDAGTVSFTYDSLGRVISVKDTDGYITANEYDADGMLIQTSDKEEYLTTFTYNASGRMTGKTDACGQTTSYTYDKNGNCTEIKDAQENTYTYAYDANGQLIKTTDPEGCESSYQYDEVGNIISYTDAKGNESKFKYDREGNLLTETNAAGGIKTYTYDALNRLTEITDEEGEKVSYEYDANGNRISYTDANGNKWTYTYDALNRMTKVTDKNDGQFLFTYQKTGEIKTITDPEGAVTTYSYDALGRMTEMSDALEHCLQFTYDTSGRVIGQRDGNGNKIVYTYSPNGNLISVTDAEGNNTGYTYDALGQILTKTDAEGNTTKYTYDALGQVTSITNAMNEKVSFTYSKRGL